MKSTDSSGLLVSPLQAATASCHTDAQTPDFSPWTQNQAGSVSCWHVPSSLSTSS